jgi:hypothetical protein
MPLGAVLAENTLETVNRLIGNPGPGGYAAITLIEGVERSAIPTRRTIGWS